MESYGHMGVECGAKYCFILVSQKFLLTNILVHPVFFLTNVIVCVSFEKIYFEQSSPCPVLEWRSTIFLTFQHHLKIPSTISMSSPCNLWVFYTFGHFLIATCLFSDSILG